MPTDSPEIANIRKNITRSITDLEQSEMADGVCSQHREVCRASITMLQVAEFNMDKGGQTCDVLEAGFLRLEDKITAIHPPLPIQKPVGLWRKAGAVLGGLFGLGGTS